MAFRLAGEGAGEGTVVLAEAQRRGRGRHGRSWFTPRGLNLCCSVLLFPPPPRPQWPELSWVVAGALASAVREEGVDGVSIKYPNDVYAAGRKLAGILLETRSGAAATGAVVVGIGVNVNPEEDDFPAPLGATATSLRILLGRVVDRECFLGALCRKLELYYDLWQARAAGGVRELLRREGIGFWGEDGAGRSGALEERSAAAEKGG